jgi:hypothetical protein
LLDGSDPAPNDPRAQSVAALGSTAVDDEPSVALSSSSITLTSAERFAVVDVSNGGAGLLEWMVEPDLDPAIVLTQPRPGEISSGTSLLVFAAPSFDFNASGAVSVDLRVRDLAGRVTDVSQLAVEVAPGGGQAGTCGDATDDGAITASDALRILQSAVGIVQCSCVCDVNGSGVTATDALAVLNAAVGLPVQLDCQSC